MKNASPAPRNKEALRRKRCVADLGLILGTPSRPTIERVKGQTLGLTKGQHSTRVSSKRQRDKRPQLSDAMRARLGPQAPGKERPPKAATWEKYPNPQSTPPPGAIPHIKYSHIINYEPQKGFSFRNFLRMMGLSDLFDHIMHYRQLMTLDIGNDALLCKVFPASLQGQALSWFHRLLMNSVDNF
ncbi:hypothetical protein CK203_082350 [Vitis vinifera]|uniref:Retrotransposon gag domain-containing protein n=1 Tax=Vitis vinifera TaxID=29760 RepID=A0A438DSL5_VITVI|nr:hypothetical protein CK203_082350 [Vitis vinifera]